MFDAAVEAAQPSHCVPAHLPSAPKGRMIVVGAGKASAAMARAAERALPEVALGRRNWTFAGSDAGGRRAAAVYSLITTCRLNDVDPRV
jgi:hypothetical protein